MGDLEHEFLDFLSQYENNTASSDLVEKKFSSRQQQLTVVINRLLQDKRITLLQDAEKSKLHYKVNEKEAIAILKKVEPGEEFMVYQVCLAAGSKGIWTRDIKLSTNIPQHALTKILKSLEKKDVLKTIRSVASKCKKLYIVSNIEPNKEITGGPWYTDQAFDDVFVSEMRKEVIKQISKSVSGNLSIPEIHNKINSKNVSNCPLSLEDIDQLVQTLVYDGELEIVYIGRDSLKKYRVRKNISVNTGFYDSPCGRCPVIAQCNIGSQISPETCVYMQDWINSLQW